MTVIIENELITGILQKEIPIEYLISETNLEPNWLEFNREIYEYILNYNQKHSEVPSSDLILTSFPYFRLSEKITPKEELIHALYNGTKEQRYLEDLNRAINLYKNGKFKESQSYLKSKIHKYDENVEQDVFDLTSEKDNNKLLEKYELRRKAREENGIVGIRTGFGQEFDNWLNGGWQKSSLYGILAASGIGKTWLSIVSAIEAMKQGKTPFVLCLEGGLEMEGFRILTVGTEIPNDALQQGTLPYNDVLWATKRLQEIGQQTGAKFYLAVRGKRQLYTPQILWQKLLKYEPDIAIVDYLGLMANEEKSDWAAAETNAYELKNMSVALDIPIIATYQGNKNSENKEKLDKTDSSFYALQRAFDGAIGVSKVKERNFIIRINDVKNRHGMTEFDAYYRTSWNKGKVQFEMNASESNYETENGEEQF